MPAHDASEKLVKIRQRIEAASEVTSIAVARAREAVLAVRDEAHRTISGRVAALAEARSSDTLAGAFAMLDRTVSAHLDAVLVQVEKQQDIAHRAVSRCDEIMRAVAKLDDVAFSAKLLSLNAYISVSSLVGGEVVAVLATTLSSLTNQVAETNARVVSSAEELLAVLPGVAAKAVVGQSIEPRRQEIKAKLEELEKRRLALRSSLDNLRKRSRESEVMASRGMTGDPLLYQRRQVESDLATKRFRLQAIHEILPRFTAQADEYGAALKGLVAAREALVAGLEKALEQGKVEPLEVLRARADLAEARVRISESARLPTIQPGRNVRDERLGLEVDIATLEAQMKAIADKKDEPANHPAEDAQALRTDLFRAEAENNNLEQQYQQARREYDQLGSPPSLVVLDGQPN